MTRYSFKGKPLNPVEDDEVYEPIEPKTSQSYTLASGRIHPSMRSPPSHEAPQTTVPMPLCSGRSLQWSNITLLKLLYKLSFTKRYCLPFLIFFPITCTAKVTHCEEKKRPGSLMNRIPCLSQ